MNILYTLGKMSFQTKRLTSTIIKHPKQAWQDIQVGYEMAKEDHEEDKRIQAELNQKITEIARNMDINKPTQGQFDFGGNK